MKAFYAFIDDHISQYEKGTVTISDDIEFSMRQTVKQITHYILSRYTFGQNDEQGRRKPFRNIGNAIVDLEWRAKNIDRKSVEAHETDGDYIFSLIVNKELQQWMKVNNFGATIDAYQRKKSEYGSVMLKKTETADKLIIEPVQWENIAVDARDIACGPKIERNYMTPLALRKKKDEWAEETDGELSIEAAIRAAKKQKGTKDENRIEVLDIECECEAALFDESPDEENDHIGLYNVILAVVSNKKFLLYKTELDESRFKHDRRKEVEGRDFGVGVWEECFEPQIWTNEAVISEKNAMDVGGKVVLKTNKKGLPSALSLMDGEVIELEADEYLDPVSLMPSAMPEFQNVIDNWFANMQRDQSAHPGITGEEPKASTPGISLELQAAQGASIFNKRRDQDGFFLLEVLTEWVLPFVVEQINKEHTLTAAYSAKELQLIDEAIREMHKNTVSRDAMLSEDMLTPGMPFGTTPEDRVAIESAVQSQLDKQGNKRTLKVPKNFITMEKINKKVRFDITDEMMDDQRRLNALAAALGQLPPGDPQRAALVQEMMEISGISSATFSMNTMAPVAAPSPVPTQSSNRITDVLPAGQKA